MKLNFLLDISEITGCKYDQISGSFKIIELIRTLSGRYGEQFIKELLDSDQKEINEGITILVNGINIEFLGGVDYTIIDSDTLTFLPEIMGG